MIELEELFIASEWSADQFLLNSDHFKACDLVRVHHFSAIGILKEVQAFIANRQLADLIAQGNKEVNESVVENIYPSKDEAYDISGYKYVVDKELLEQAKPIKIDFMGMNFNITSSMVFEGGCGSCGSSSSGCS